MSLEETTGQIERTKEEERSRMKVRECRSVQEQILEIVSVIKFAIGW